VRKASVASKAQAGQKARERRARGQSLALEQGHEGLRKREELLVKLLQGAFTTDGVAKEDGEKVNHLVVPKAAASKAHEAQVMASRTPRLRRCWTMSTTSPSQQGIEGTASEVVWMFTGESAILVMSTSLLGKFSILPSKEAHFMPTRY